MGDVAFVLQFIKGQHAALALHWPICLSQCCFTAFLFNKQLGTTVHDFMAVTFSVKLDIVRENSFFCENHDFL